MKTEVICIIIIVVLMFVLYKVFNRSSESYDFLSPSAESITDPYWRYYAFAGRHL